MAMRLFFGSALIAVASAVALPSFAQPGPGGMGPAGMGPGPGGPFGGSPRHIDRMLDSVNATDAQRTQIKAILAAAATDMKAQHQAGRALHEKARAIFVAPTIDANAAEQIRLQMLAQHDQMSRKTLQVMLDIAQVLTPDQRAKLGDLMAKRGERMREHMRQRPQDGTAPKS
jgi:Spy/CpxP family protein refolding chaperone